MAGKVTVGLAEMAAYHWVYDFTGVPLDLATTLVSSM